MILIVLPDFGLEQSLLASARRGDRDAIMQIYDLYFTPIYHFIRLRVGDAMTAEDLAADVFTHLIAALRGPSPPRDSLRGWLFKVARNLIAQHHQAARRIEETELDEWLADDGDLEAEVTLELDAAITGDRVRAALAALAPDQQEVLLLRFGQKLDLQTTASVMGKSVNAIKQLQFRALAALRRRLSGAVMEN